MAVSHGKEQKAGNSCPRPNTINETEWPTSPSSKFQERKTDAAGFDIMG